MAKLYFKYGSMNSGKTLEILTTTYSYEEKEKKVLLLTSAIDNRYQIGKITSRIGLQRNAIPIFKDTNIIKLFIEESKKIKVDIVLIDESQFLTTQQILELSDIVDKYNVTVICFGLRSDFQGNLFEGSAKLLAIADKIEEIKVMCHCGKKAIINARIDKSGSVVYEGEQIKIGGNDTYISLCRKCWKERKIK